MRRISTYDKQFREAKKNLAKDEEELLRVTKQMTQLQQKKTELEERIKEDRKNKVEKGLLYYSSKRRMEILDKAEKLPYSPEAIRRLRALKEEHWNCDAVDDNIIKDLEAVERYVAENTPEWERWPITKMGKLLRGE